MLSLYLCGPKDQNLFASIINEHHSYIKHSRTPTRRIHWLIKYGNETIGAIGINSATLNLKARDEYAGVTPSNRFKRLLEGANNYRFCLIKSKLRNLPKNIGTQVLALLRKEAPKEWYKKYKNELRWIETFVLPSACDGALYKADNWDYLGLTSGYTASRIPTKLLLKQKNGKAYVKKYTKERKSAEYKKTEPKFIFIHKVSRQTSKRKIKKAVGVNFDREKKLFKARKFANGIEVFLGYHKTLQKANYAVKKYDRTTSALQI